ncbi:hypothetical protein V5E97_18585 [Singulisphaera sp. Ch08]|uniref:DUF4870 domain-containing protein n=1 Tax=Singulisphaera sp. Ch08 TaxID=3120278 RepID=A0AAU7CS49_9BACT
MNHENPYAAPEFSSLPRTDYSDQAFGFPNTEGCWQDGNLLVLSDEARLPDRCIKCNLPANDYRLKRKLAWHPPIWYVTALISPLLYVIVALCIRQTVRIEVGLCENHRRRRSLAITYAWLAILGGIGLALAGAFWIDSTWFPLPLLFAFILVIAGIIVGILSAQVVTTKTIYKHHAWLANVDPEYLKMLPAWLD